MYPVIIQRGIRFGHQPGKEHRYCCLAELWVLSPCTLTVWANRTEKCQLELQQIFSLADAWWLIKHLHFLSLERHGLIKLSITMRYSSSKPWHHVYHVHAVTSRLWGQFLNSFNAGLCLSICAATSTSVRRDTEQKWFCATRPAPYAAPKQLTLHFAGHLLHLCCWVVLMPSQNCENWHGMILTDGFGTCTCKWYSCDWVHIC